MVLHCQITGPKTEEKKGLGSRRSDPQTLSQSFLTSSSGSCLHWLSCSIQQSISCSMMGLMGAVLAEVGSARCKAFYVD